MLELIKSNVWSQFGASIDMLKNAIVAMPEDRWESNRKFFYLSYHVLVFLDYYLTIPPDDFKPFLSFTINEQFTLIEDAIDDVMPDRIYTKNELLEYADFCRDKCRSTIQHLTEEKLAQRWIEDNGAMDYAFYEMLMYNMRHVQHHTAQLNMILRKEINTAPKWIARAKHD